MILTEGKETVFVIPDLQCPFEHPDAVEFMRAVARKNKPTRIVCIGDSMDQHALSRWATDPDGLGPRDEYEQAIEHLRPVYKLFPEAIEVASNHNERIAKRAYEAAIPSVFLRDYSQIMQYPPGWHLEQYVEIEGVLYEHGNTQGGMYAARNIAYHNGQSTVIGHHHSHAGVQYIASRKKMWWGMNVGCLIDVDAYAFRYSKEQKFKPTLGCGVVIRGVPYFVPMLIDRKGRWNGKVVM